jgi:phage baseplate assembly protein V
MLRFGNITEVDPSKGYARVTFTDDGIVSDWLQVCVMGAISDSFSHTFTINEQVACLMDENSEEGVILGALFNDSKSPNGGGKGIFRVKFEDNSVIEYNKNTHKYTLDIKGEISIKSTSVVNIDSVNANVNTSGTASISATNANVTATTLAKIEAPIIQLNGIVAVTGPITVTGTISGPSGTPVTGNLEVAGDVKAGTVSLKTHVHSGVTTGGGTSGQPIP